MPKKSRKTAAKYSELSKAGKRKQRERRSPVVEPAVEQATGPVVGTGSSPAKSSVTQLVSRSQISQVKPVLKRSTSTYKLVRADLKRIGILAVGIILILFILSFVL